VLKLFRGLMFLELVSLELMPSDRLPLVVMPLALMLQALNRPERTHWDIIMLVHKTLAPTLLGTMSVDHMLPDLVPLGLMPLDPMPLGLKSPEFKPLVITGLVLMPRKSTAPTAKHSHNGPLRTVQRDTRTTTPRLQTKTQESDTSGPAVPQVKCPLPAPRDVVSRPLTAQPLMLLQSAFSEASPPDAVRPSQRMYPSAPTRLEAADLQGSRRALACQTFARGCDRPVADGTERKTAGAVAGPPRTAENRNQD